MIEQDAEGRVREGISTRQGLVGKLPVLLNTFTDLNTDQFCGLSPFEPVSSKGSDGK